MEHFPMRGAVPDRRAASTANPADSSVIGPFFRSSRLHRFFRRSIAIGTRGHGANPDACGQAHLLTGVETIDVTRTKRAQPADLPAIVVDDHVSENRAGQAQRALDAGKDIGVAGNMVVAQADP